jgi:NAD(P)-dependent dehydrogenase (short-subunit alcohol dehydrogenase family)
VTGAAHGIGAAIDAGLAADGLAVVAGDLNLAGDAGRRSQRVFRRPSADRPAGSNHAELDEPFLDLHGGPKP